MAANDLTTLADVKSWLGRTDTNSDALIASLITRASRAICSYLQRPLLLPHDVSEVQDGTGGNILLLKEWPVLSVSSLVVDGITIPQATQQSPGWVLDAWNGAPPGRMQALRLRGYSFGSTARNVATVQVAYQAGYQIASERQIVTAGEVSVVAPFGPWASDEGVTYANGTPLALVTVVPMIGQYALDAEAGTYDFAAGDDGAAILISYGFVPYDLADAAIELVCERYKYSQRVGEKSHSLGGNETVSFDTTRFTPLVASLLQPYRNVPPL
jgi:Phage gp6-like head-tail connector protein